MLNLGNLQFNRQKTSDGHTVGLQNKGIRTLRIGNCGESQYRLYMLC